MYLGVELCDYVLLIAAILRFIMCALNSTFEVEDPAFEWQRNKQGSMVATPRYKGVAKQSCSKDPQISRSVSKAQRIPVGILKETNDTSIAQKTPCKALRIPIPQSHTGYENCVASIVKTPGTALRVPVTPGSVTSMSQHNEAAFRNTIYRMTPSLGNGITSKNSSSVAIASGLSSISKVNPKVPVISFYFGNSYLLFNKYSLNN